MTQKITEALLELPDYFKHLSSGEKAKLRRAHKPDELFEISGFFELCGHSPILQERMRQMKNVVFFLPWVQHHSEENHAKENLGEVLQDISEMRMFQVIRSDYPNDLLYLWRLVRMAAGKRREKVLKVNWEETSKTLFYWGDESKRRILRDFYQKQYFKKSEGSETQQ